MTLPAYPNAISLQQIQAEFGGSSSNIALENYYAGGANVPSGTTSPTSGAVPSSGAISLENFWGTSKGYNNWYYNWIGYSNAGNFDNYVSGTGVDSSGNIYSAGVFGGNFSSPYLTGYVNKFTSKGVIQWTRTIGLSSGVTRVYGSATSSAGNTYAALVSGSSAYLVKYNSSGTLQWQVAISGTSVLPMGIQVSSAENVYVLTNSSTTVYTMLKFNSSGTLQWQRQLSGDPNVVQYRGCMGMDSSENTYAIFQSLDSTYGAAYYAVEYNSSGTIQYINYYTLGSGTTNFAGGALPIMYIGPSGSYYYALPVTATGTNNITYFIGVPGAGGLYMTLASYPTLTTFLAMTADSSGNVYIVDNSPNYGTSYLKIPSTSGSWTEYVTSSIGGTFDNISGGGITATGSNILFGSQGSPSNATSANLIYTENNGTNFTTASEYTTGTTYTLTLRTASVTDSAGTLSVSSTSALTDSAATPYSSSLNGLT